MLFFVCPGCPKTNALSELLFCETGFDGMWPSTASWLLIWQWKAIPSNLVSQKGNSESAFFGTLCRVDRVPKTSSAYRHCRLKIVCASEKLCANLQNWLYNLNQLKIE